MTVDQQVEAWRRDQLADAEHAEQQAQEGPFFPERGITAETLNAYAQSCRQASQRPATTLCQEMQSWGLPGETLVGFRLKAEIEGSGNCA